MNIYVELTRLFNDGRLRAILAGGQAVVLHRLAVMSKDGDWILREDEESLNHIRSVLSHYGARYRFGAPLDVNWLSGGWSSHLEFSHDGMRIRTDFVTRPPRMDDETRAQLWSDKEGESVPFVDAPELADLKMTDREKDYAVIGELARSMSKPEDQILYSRSALDLIQLAASFPDRVKSLAAQRPVLTQIPQGRDVLEAALDAERRVLMRINEERLARYMSAAGGWEKAWPQIAREIEGFSLPDAHRRLVLRAAGVLPVNDEGYDHA